MTEAQKTTALYHLLKAEELTRRMADPEYGLEPAPTKTHRAAIIVGMLVLFLVLALCNLNPPPF